MKPAHRRRLDKANKPKDLWDQFRELQKLRLKVLRAELEAGQKKTVDVETRVGGNGRGKTINRSRTH